VAKTAKWPTRAPCPLTKIPYWLATAPVCIPAGTDFTQVRHGEMTTVAAALAVRCRVVPPELFAEADAVKIAAVAAPAATTAIALPACRLTALPSAPVSMIAPPSLAQPAQPAAPCRLAHG